MDESGRRTATSHSRNPSSGPSRPAASRSLCYRMSGTSDYSGVKLRNVVRSRNDVVRLGGCVVVGWVVYLCTGARCVRITSGCGCEREVHATRPSRACRGEGGTRSSCMRAPRGTRSVTHESHYADIFSLIRGSYYGTRTTVYCLLSPRFSPTPLNSRSTASRLLSCDPMHTPDRPRLCGEAHKDLPTAEPLFDQLVGSTK